MPSCSLSVPEFIPRIHSHPIARSERVDLPGPGSILLYSMRAVPPESPVHPVEGEKHSQLGLFSDELPRNARLYPEFRYMGSKHRLLPWIHAVLQTIEFRT